MEALRRYTNLPAVLRMLRSKSITLLLPDTWDDVNDRRLLEAYRRGKGLETVLCLCFAEAAETYHHWKVFAPGTDGICVVFDKQTLLDSLRLSDVQHKTVDYYTVKRLSASAPKIDDLPFSKRAAYKSESEYRLLWTSRDVKESAKDFVLPVKAFERLIINPWLAKVLADEVVTTIHSIPGFNHVEVLQSAVTDGSAWKKLADSYPYPLGRADRKR